MDISIKNQMRTEIKREFLQEHEPLGILYQLIKAYYH